MNLFLMGYQILIPIRPKLRLLDVLVEKIGVHTSWQWDAPFPDK